LFEEIVVVKPPVPSEIPKEEEAEDTPVKSRVVAE